VRGKTIIDAGAQNVNGSLRDAAPSAACYLGVEFMLVAGVDVKVVFSDPHHLSFDTSTVNAVVNSSCFEPIEFFWLIFIEILRVFKPGGLFYLNAPSKSEFHRHPIDCWRFYPDAGQALARWAVRSGYSPVLLQSFQTCQRPDIWNDFLAIFLKDSSRVTDYPVRVLDRIGNYTHGLRHGSADFLQGQAAPKDLARLQMLTGHLKPTTQGRSGFA
jgi:SAM-dependent methyltransferase